LNKLEHCGIRGVANQWVRSYLSDRIQYCTMNNVKSTELRVKCGVPQGSILGPLLFLLYINDLGPILHNMNPILFADDTNLITSSTSLLSLEQKINLEIPKLINWLHTNRLSLNIKKTHIMIFGPSNKKQNHHIHISIEGEVLQIVQSTKFLGIILDKNLNWKEHISYLALKISKSVGILSRARQLLSSDILRQLYYSFLYPYLCYCNIIWGQAPSVTLWPLLKMQKRAIRIICNIRQRDSSTASFKKLKILKLPDIHTFAVLNFMFKFKNDLLPDTFNDFYQENQVYHRYPTRGANQLRAPKIKTKIAEMFIKNSGAALWNIFSPQINIKDRIKPFKQEVITLLISRY
jgi:hypothetical protein